MLRNLLRSPRHNDLPTLVTTLGTEVDDPVRTTDHIRQWVSPFTVAETVRRLHAGFQQQGFEIRAELNHQRMAREQGRRIPANTALLISKPSLDAVVLAANPLANLFLPFTIAVWDQAGTTRIGYWNPKTDIAALLEIKQGEAAAALADLQEILADVIKETLP